MSSGVVELQKANLTLDILHQIGILLDCKLDKEELGILVSLLEEGVNPEVR